LVLSSRSNSSPSCEKNIHVLYLIIYQLHNIEYMDSIKWFFDINLDQTNIIVQVSVHFVLFFGHHSNNTGISVNLSLIVNANCRLKSFIRINLHSFFLKFSDSLLDKAISIIFIFLLCNVCKLIKNLVLLDLDNLWGIWLINFLLLDLLFQLNSNGWTIYSIIDAWLAKFILNVRISSSFEKHLNNFLILPRSYLLLLVLSWINNWTDSPVKSCTTIAILGI